MDIAQRYQMLKLIGSNKYFSVCGNLIFENILLKK